MEAPFWIVRRGWRRNVENHHRLVLNDINDKQNHYFCSGKNQKFNLIWVLNNFLFAIQKRIIMHCIHSKFFILIFSIFCSIQLETRIGILISQMNRLEFSNGLFRLNSIMLVCLFCIRPPLNFHLGLFKIQTKICSAIISFYAKLTQRI